MLPLHKHRNQKDSKFKGAKGVINLVLDTLGIRFWEDT